MKDPFTYGDYNHDCPLPPLQIFWSKLGSKCYFLKHKSKSIATLPNGKVDFEKDYTEFWYKNFVRGGVQGYINIGKAMAQNLDDFLSDPVYKNVKQYWA